MVTIRLLFGIHLQSHLSGFFPVCILSMDVYIIYIGRLLNVFTKYRTIRLFYILFHIDLFPHEQFEKFRLKLRFYHPTEPTSHCSPNESNIYINIYFNIAQSYIL